MSYKQLLVQDIFSILLFKLFSWFLILVALQIVKTIYSEKLVKIKTIFSIISNYFDLSWNVSSIS